MDGRTSQVLEALDPSAIDLLLELLETPSTEKALVETVGHISQPTIHRKLRQLASARVVGQPARGKHARGHPWVVSHPGETAGLITALISLSDAIDDADRKERSDMTNQLDKSSRRKLRVVPG